MRSLFTITGYELTFVFCFLVIIINGQQDEQAICRSRDNSKVTWTCKRIEDCPLSARLKGISREYPCGSDRRQTKICCPDKKNETSTRFSTATSSPAQYIKIINEKCTKFAEARYQNVCRGGEIIGQKRVCEYEKDCKQKTETLIVNGKETETKEFPHMALIGYGEQLSDVEWNCGGSLISERFVLTAAHCAKAPKPPKWIGLGLLHRNSYTPEVLNKNIFPIMKKHIHPGYKQPKENNDIALFELRNPLVFSAYIRPVCLHTEPDIPPTAKNNATIIGWGKVGAGDVDSNAQLKATIAFLSPDSCKKIYANEKYTLQNGFDDQTMICAGDIRKTNIDDIRDTCGGDSGGPIQMNHKEECMYLQAGITSLGPVFCGGGNPAIYTRIYPYLEWIQRIVWPQKQSRV